MSNEDFAAHLGVAVRTVAYWRKEPDIVPRPVIQDALDTALEQVSDRVKAQFSLLVKNKRSDNNGEVLQPVISNLGSHFSPDDAARIEAIERRPSRLDATAVESLGQVLKSQRRLDDMIGSSALIRPATVQMDVVCNMLSGASGPYRDDLARVAAEWITFVGWLHTAVRLDDQAIDLFTRAEDLADDIGDGINATVATSFRGYVAQLQGKPRGVIRSSAAALATPGAHPAQQVMDRLLTAQGYAELGDKERARRFLDLAADSANSAGTPPAVVYWYTEPFFRLNIGLTLAGIGEYRDAIVSLKSGMDDMPVDQQNAEWLTPYQRALDDAGERV